MEGADGESYILPELENDDTLTNSCSWTMVKPTNVNEKDSTVNIKKVLVATSTLGLLRDNDLQPTHLDILTSTHLKDDKAISAIPLDSGNRKDKAKDRNAILPLPPVVKKEISSEQLSRTTKDRLLFLCILLLFSIAGCLTLKLDVSKRLNLQLQEELNQTTGLLNSYRVRQEWIINKEKMRKTNSFDIETCWLEASLALGQCSSDRLEQMKIAYRNTYKDLASFFAWETVFPHDSKDPATTSFHQWLQSFQYHERI